MMYKQQVAGMEDRLRALHARGLELDTQVHIKKYICTIVVIYNSNDSEYTCRCWY
jgi:hypothetical protein